MEAKELMIGDWVGRVFDDKRIIEDYRQVDWIRTGEIGMRYQKVWSIGCIEPIPLTDEILRRNGFAEGEESNLFNYWEENFELEHPLLMKVNVKFRNLISIQITRDHWGDYIQVSGNAINYVHELQRALRCCGLWDLADSFVV